MRETPKKRHIHLILWVTWSKCWRTRKRAPARWARSRSLINPTDASAAGDQGDRVASARASPCWCASWPSARLPRQPSQPGAHAADRPRSRSWSRRGAASGGGTTRLSADIGHSGDVLHDGDGTLGDERDRAPDGIGRRGTQRSGRRGRRSSGRKRASCGRTRPRRVRTPRPRSS
jgi:hypothetical protein